MRRKPARGAAHGRRADDRIAQLEAENRRLKAVVGEMALDILLSPMWFAATPAPPRKMAHQTSRPRR